MNAETTKIMGESKPTLLMLAVNQSTIEGYPHPSISSRKAFDWILEKMIRDNISGFKLLFLHVQVPDDDEDSVHGSSDMNSKSISPDDSDKQKSEGKSKGLHLLEYFVQKCHEIGIACEAFMRKGNPREQICNEVNRVHPDLLVVGSRGLGRFQRVFVGTVSEYCVKHAACPVVTIKRPVEETPRDPIDD